MSIVFLITMILSTIAIVGYAVYFGVSLYKKKESIEIGDMISFGAVVVVALISTLAFTMTDTGSEKVSVSVSKEERGEIEQFTLKSLQDNLGDTMDVTFDEKKKDYILKPKDPQFALDVISLIVSDRGLEDWKSLAASVEDLSATVESALGKGYMVKVVNPVDEDILLLSAMNGEIVYDEFIGR